jgi:hypothetical protein
MRLFCALKINTIIIIFYRFQLFLERHLKFIDFYLFYCFGVGRMSVGCECLDGGNWIIFRNWIVGSLRLEIGILENQSGCEDV